MEKIELPSGAIFYQKSEEQKQQEKKAEVMKEKLKELTENTQIDTSLKQSERIANLEKEVKELKEILLHYIGT